MSNEQLVTLFKNVREIRGVLQIWNTQLTTVTFTRNIQTLTGDPLDKALSVLNNTKLSNINITSLVKSSGKIEIKNNPNLNLQKSCSIIHDVYFNRRFISGNSFDCGCELIGYFKWPNVKNFPENCIVLYGNIIIEGVAPPIEILYRLSTVTKLYGYLEFKMTNLETLGFLQNLEEIESGVEAEVTMNIDSNRYLRRLDLIKLKSIKSKNPESEFKSYGNALFCVDPAFVESLAKSSIKTIKLFENVGYCGLDKMNNPLSYCTGKLSTIPERCTRYIGNILYFNDMWSDYAEIQNYTKIPQADMKKMQQLEIIFGTIYIHGTTLTNFSLPNLKEIYQIESLKNLPLNTVIAFSRNDFLKEVSFPNLETAFQLMYFTANGNLTMDSSFCRKMSNGVKRLAVGMDSQYDCIPNLTDETTTIGS